MPESSRLNIASATGILIFDRHAATARRHIFLEATASHL
jgi:hypothetical protein